MQLSEDILHFIWRHGSFDMDDLKTTKGQSIQLINRGIHNHHSGPDFMEAKIKLDNTIWAGQVEIHINASDWYLHHHEKDRAYDNVILHVVYFDDKDVFIKGQKIPTLKLNGRVPPLLFSRYKDLLLKKNEISCSYSIDKMNKTILVSQLERSVIDRLERKANKILNLHSHLNNDWEETIFQIVCIQMMGKLNEQPMEWMLAQIKLKQLRQFGKGTNQKEAILFGIAGMLKATPDDYSKSLANEFTHLKNKFNLIELDSHIWRFGRIRPAHFPSIRIAQIVSLINKNEFLFDSLLNGNIDFIIKEFLNVEANTYWKTHHKFGEEIKKRSVKIGEMQKDLMIINVIAPFLFAYGIYHSDEIWKEKAANLLLSKKPENNHIVRKWLGFGWKPDSAFDSQGMIELYNNFCIPKKCLTCNIGTTLLRA